MFFAKVLHDVRLEILCRSGYTLRSPCLLQASLLIDAAFRSPLKRGCEHTIIIRLFYGGRIFLAGLWEECKDRSAVCIAKILTC